MATGIRPDVMTPDRIETRIGTLEFFRGLPNRRHGAKGIRQCRLPARARSLPHGEVDAQAFVVVTGRGSGKVQAAFSSSRSRSTPRQRLCFLLIVSSAELL